MFVKLLILSAVLLSVAALFFGVRILLKNNGVFPEIHISQNREMRKRGISCGGDPDIGCTSPGGFKECPSCGKILPRMEPEPENV